MIDLDILRKSDYILCFGQFLANTNEQIVEAINEAKKSNNAEVIYMHAVDSLALKDFYTQFIKYEAGSEEGISALLLDTFVKNTSEKVQAYIDDLDIGYISAESSAGEEEFEEAFEKSLGKTNKTILVGEDIFSHKRVDNILKILSAIEKYSDLKLLSSMPIDTQDENIEEVEELLPFNGTVVYSYLDSSKDSNIVYASASFSRIAKVEDKANIKLTSNEGEVLKKLIVDDTLQSTIAICATNKKGSDFLSCGYIYKPVKIERLEE